MASLLCPRATVVRGSTLVSRTASTQFRTPFSTYSTSRKQAKQQQLSLQAQHKPLHRPILSKTPREVITSIRHASSNAPASSPSPSASSSNGNSQPDLLTWDRFFDLRKKRRYINLVTSIATATTTVAIAGPIIAQQDVDTWGAQISGMDPMVVLGVTTFAAAAGGWLCGPSFGSALFSLWAGRRGWNKLIAEKEKSFYARIKRYRADPSSSSPQNPIPDYYGEKIASVKDYRRWLKDQQAFNLKKSKNMI